MTAKPVNQRVADFRARRALEGLSEVRGIYLPPPLHKMLRDRARRLLAAFLRTSKDRK